MSLPLVTSRPTYWWKMLLSSNQETKNSFKTKMKFHRNTANRQTSHLWQATIKHTFLTSHKLFCNSLLSQANQSSWWLITSWFIMEVNFKRNMKGDWLENCSYKPTGTGGQVAMSRSLHWLQMYAAHLTANRRSSQNVVSIREICDGANRLQLVHWTEEYWILSEKITHKFVSVADNACVSWFYSYCPINFCAVSLNKICQITYFDWNWLSTMINVAIICLTLCFWIITMIKWMLLKNSHFTSKQMNISTRFNRSQSWLGKNNLNFFYEMWFCL